MMELDDKTKAEMVGQIADLIAEKYILPEIGQQVADRLRQAVREKASFLTLPAADFANALMQEYLAIAQDTHLRLDYAPERAADNSEELMHLHFKQARRSNFGFAKIERLAGNIGYLMIHEFAPPAQQIAIGAMAVVAHTQALIFDIRGNKGGTAEMVQLMISYLVGDTPQPLSGIYARATGQTRPFQTLSEIPGIRMSAVPVYILVDRETHSAAEAFAYDLQALKRATIIGERTRGGAHLVDFIPLHRLFVLMLPIARAINPLTGGNWQGSGVVPNIEISPEDALQVAHRRALDDLLESATDADEKAFLEAEIETL